MLYYALGVQVKLSALGIGGAVLDKRVRHTNAMHGNIVETGFCEGFQYS